MKHRGTQTVNGLSVSSQQKRHFNLSALLTFVGARKCVIMQLIDL